MSAAAPPKDRPADLDSLDEDERARALLAAIVESAEDAIISKTLDGVITSWNAGAERLFGYTAAEAIGQPVLMLIPRERSDEEALILERLRRGERVEHFETVRRRKDGSLVDISLTISPVRDSSGRIVGASKIARDITERRVLEAEALRARAERDALLAGERAARAQAEHLSAMKDEFLATLSHELRTPLSSVLGWAQVLRRQRGSEADLLQGLDIIERNARIQGRLIDDLLDMSRITSGKVRLEIQSLQPAECVVAAINALRPTAEAKGVRLEAVLDPLAGPIRGDPNRLQQVAWNLLSNAIKFTPRGGRVQVVVRRTESRVEIEVADTGIGIDPDFMPYVFDRFRQADASTTRVHGGLGLGLAIVRRLVELHGGTVHAQSGGRDRGTRFVVELPLAVVQGEVSVTALPAESRPPEATPFTTMDLAGIKVLIVDDEPDARELIGRVLTDCAADVFLAGSAAEGLELVDRHRPDVLVSDIGMPETDGYEFLRRVRALGDARGGKVPAVALTAFARSEDRVRALRAGFLAHVAKPVDASELAVTIASVAGRTGNSGPAF